jgi:hypothetical protein
VRVLLRATAVVGVGQDPDDDPLSAYVDVDSLSRLVEAGEPNADPEKRVVTFEAWDVLVCITPTEVELYDVDGGDAEV